MPASDTTTHPVPSAPPRARLLVVEDDEVLRSGFAEALRRQSYCVLCANDLQTALNMISDIRFDLVVTDLELPDGSGLEVVEAASRVKSPPPVLIASSAGSEGAIEAGFRAGAHDYLLKPFPLSLLTSKVEHVLLRRSGALAELLPGGLDRAFGRFEVGEELGRGGQGVVHKARDLTTGVEVALKLYRPSSDEKLRQRSLREAYALARVSHPALPRIVAHGQCDLDYLALAFLNGPTLGRRVRLQGPLTASETLALVRRLAGGLEALHAADLIHRDIKPDNVILLDGDPSQAVLTDFGLAKLPCDEALTATGKISGTTRYMSPEQIQGHELTPRSDLFSLGLLGCFAASGRVHHAALNGTSLAKAMATCPIPVPEVEEPLRGVLARLVETDPARRPRDCADLICLVNAATE